MKKFSALLFAVVLALLIAPAASAASAQSIAAKLAYPKALGTYKMRLTKAEKKALARDAATGVAAIKNGQTDVYATTDKLDAIMAYYHESLTKQGYKNVSPKSGKGNIQNSGYSKGGWLVTLTAVSDPNNNISLEKGQTIPPGNQAVVVGVNKEL